MSGGKRYQDELTTPRSGLRLPPIMSIGSSRYLPDPTTPTPGPRIADLLDRGPSIPISDPDRATAGQAQHTLTYRPAYIWRRSERSLAQIRHLPRNVSLVIFSPTIAPPRGGRSRPDNPFEILGRTIQQTIPHVEHADFSVINDEPFLQHHGEFCCIASAVVMIMCETTRAGVGTWRRQEKFAQTMLRLVEKRVATERIEIPVVLIRIGDNKVSRSVSGFDVEIVAEEYTDAELENIAVVLFRG